MRLVYRPLIIMLIGSLTLPLAWAAQPQVPDTPGTGRFPAMKEETASLPSNVLYRPANIAAMGSTKLGVYVFGNGACVNDGASSRLHLLEVASHGYLAFAPGRILSGPGAKATPPGQPAQSSVKSSYKDMLAAIDWAVAQNADPKSPYFLRIDTKAIAASGSSCGGAQAMRVAADPRVKTLVMMNSGLFGDDENTIIPEMDVRKSALKALHTPTLYVMGGETDIAYNHAMDDFRRIEHVPVMMANLLGVGHGGSYWQPNGGKAATVVVAWLDWQLRGDAGAARTFVGADCGLCRDKAWSVEKKRID
ncbi:MAG: hypothetical protein ABIQ86_07860 [Steroidobacteraceae bacterium]